MLLGQVGLCLPGQLGGMSFRDDGLRARSCDWCVRRCRAWVIQNAAASISISTSYTSYCSSGGASGGGGAICAAL